MNSDSRGGSTRRPRFSVNITPAERAARILLGAAATVAALALVATANSAVAVVLEILLAAAGLDLVVTGAIGYCPLYHKLGRVPQSWADPQ